VSADEHAREAYGDFALWKAWTERDGAVAWESPWGKGRPGWHIECSCMSMKHLGESLDIHCGGEDLVFPHHEDEIAQSEAATGRPFARFWVHNAYLLVNGQKMSKSAGNFFTAHDLFAKGYAGRELRYALLSANYRLPLNFTSRARRGASGPRPPRRVEERLRAAAGTASAPSAGGPLREAFGAALDDDLNISAALGCLFEPCAPRTAPSTRGSWRPPKRRGTSPTGSPCGRRWASPRPPEGRAAGGGGARPRAAGGGAPRRTSSAPTPCAPRSQSWAGR